jgi:hypothetical protein
LKAPSVIAGRPELSQLEDYGLAIQNDPQFSSSTAQWDLILVTGSLDKPAKSRIQNADFELGKFWSPEPEQGQPKVTAYVRRWRDIIDENRRRLDYLTSTLQHDPSLSEGLGYIRAKHADLLPSSLAGAATQGPYWIRKPFVSRATTTLSKTSRPHGLGRCCLSHALRPGTEEEGRARRCGALLGSSRQR